MSLYALDNLDDALNATRVLLTPIDRSTWVKLAFVVLFIGGAGANLNTFQSSFGGNGDGAPPASNMPGIEPDPQLWVLVAGVAGLFLLLGLAFALIGSIMEFVFVESLQNRRVTVRRYWSQRWRQGFRLFGFRVVIGSIVLGSTLLLGAFEFLFFDTISAGTVGLIILLLVPAIVTLAVVIGLVSGFTTVFVVPIMLIEECGVLEGWRHLWPTITSQWKQYLAYAIASFFLSILGGILTGIITAILAVILLIPFGVLFALALALGLTLADPLAIIVGVVLGTPYALAVIAVAALVQVPVQTYLRYYALLILGDVDPRFDLIPDQRATIRDTTAVK